MRLLKVVTFFFLIHSWSFATDFSQVDYSGIWNLSFEFNGKKISKNEILIFKTINRFNDSTMYSVRGYLRHEEILAMFAYFDEENKVYKIRFMTLNTGIRTKPSTLSQTSSNLASGKLILPNAGSATKKRPS